MKAMTYGIGVILASLSYGQGGSGGSPVDPRILEHFNAANAKTRMADHLMTMGQVAEAITFYKDAVTIEDTKYPHRSSLGNYNLAKAYVIKGDNPSALEAFKRATFWDSAKKDLDTNGPPQTLLVMDYTIALAKAGKLEDAKALYYFGLRTYNPHNENSFEPVPFLIVFDDDEGADVWKSTAENIIFAAQLAKLPFSSWRQEELLAELMKSHPKSMYPHLYKANLWIGPNRDESMAIAARLAEPGFQTRLIDSIKDPTLFNSNRPGLRQKLKAVSTNKEKLAELHQNIGS